jgi:hypothetical protein
VIDSISLNAAVNATVFRAVTSPISATFRNFPPSESSYRTNFALIATESEDSILSRGLSTQGVVELIEDGESVLETIEGVMVLRWPATRRGSRILNLLENILVHELLVRGHRLLRLT